MIDECDLFIDGLNCSFGNVHTRYLKDVHGYYYFFRGPHLTPMNPVFTNEYGDKLRIVKIEAVPICGTVD
jgi:hypothetical protein